MSSDTNEPRPVTFHVSRFTFLLAGPVFLRPRPYGQTDAGDLAVCDAVVGLLAVAKVSGLWAARVRKVAVFCAGGGFVRHHISGATPGRHGRLAGSNPAALSFGQCAAGLYALSA